MSEEQKPGDPKQIGVKVTSGIANNLIILQFSQTIPWVGFNVQEARDMSQRLTDLAKQLEESQQPGSQA